MKLAIAAVVALAMPLAAHTPPMAAALADPTRPAADKGRDAARKPTEFVIFAGVKPGDKVADYIMGGGYWTRILSNVVGPKGKVYAYQPEEFVKFRAAYGTEQDAAVAGRANVAPLRTGIGVTTFPEPLDAIVTVQNWHDLHLKMAQEGTGKYIASKLFAALKPGGVLIVADNASAPGTGFTVADTLHRAEGSAVRKEIESAGFVFERESAMWANAADDAAKLVFDPTVRGKVSQFVYKFRKPK